MTPEQANRAATILELNAPADIDNYAACLAAIEHLRSIAAKSACTWQVEGGDLYAADPGGRILTFPRIAGLASVMPTAWSLPGEPVRVGLHGRAAAKAQRYRLAERLRQRGLYVLAQAVEDIKLRSAGAAVYAVYDPVGVPVQVSNN